MIGINFDVSELQDLMDIGAGMKSMTGGAAGAVAEMIMGKAKEIANDKLNSRRQMYVEGLSVRKENDDTYVVVLDGKVRWIDDGLTQFNMLEGLLKSSKAKPYKDGSGDKYIIVPFKYGPNVGPTTTTPAHQDLIKEVKDEMKKRSIPWGKLEKDAQGNAKMGRLHAFDITKAPLKMVDGPGMGKGAIGDVRQGNTGIPFLQGVSVYQNKDKEGKDKRTVLTFRVASSRHKDQGKWEHPGVAATNILGDATEWAMKELERELAPAIINNILGTED